MSEGPYLVLAAFWSEDPDTEAIAAAVRVAKFPVPEGYPPGAVVAFRREVADSPRFRRDLGRFDLKDLSVAGTPSEETE